MFVSSDDWIKRVVTNDKTFIGIEIDEVFPVIDVILTSDKSISQRMKLVDRDRRTVQDRCLVRPDPPAGSQGTGLGSVIVISTLRSQLLLKTSIKFYNGPHLW